ncbi:MAG: hypothetical protein P8N52_06540 [Crocinitomicaceae bacterium]|nr:hypothetical protein [Crocinitomicaceae bacterium]MDG1775921.1 hypothetical protein [Crocinitomicaceae bacterium]
MKRIIFTLNIITLVLIFTACSSSSPRQSTKSALSAFLSNNELVVGFGSVDLKALLTKSDYKSIPKIGILLGGEMTVLEKLINFDAPVYYALEGPIDFDGAPTATYAFFNVKSKDSLIAELTQRGFDVNTKKELHYCSDGDVSIGIKGTLAIVASINNTISDQLEFDTEKLLTKTFKKAEGNTSGGKIDEILADEGDVVIAMNMTNMLTGSDLLPLSQEKQLKLETLVKDSYIQTIMKFEDGAGIIEIRNYFSKELSDYMFFNSDKKAPIIAKLGRGTPQFGFSMNLDLRKMQDLVNEFSPDAVSELGKMIGGPAQFALMTAGNDGFAGLFNGQFGFVVVGEPDMMKETIPDFNLHLGLEKNGKHLGNLIRNLMSYGSAEVTLNDEGLSASTNTVYTSLGSSSLNLPNGCEHFGQSGINAFLNLEGVNLDDLSLEDEATILKVVKYITFEYDENGGRLYIKAKHGQENVLKQGLQVLIDEFSFRVN